MVNLVNRFNFNSSDDIHTLSHLYESMLREMRDAAGTNGEFYTPRPVVRFMVDRLAPHIGETVYDPAVGTCGFLVEAYEYMKEQQRTLEDRETLQTRTLYGTEKKPMPYLLGMMNLLLHGIEYPNLVRDNSLARPLTEITDRQRHDVILTNPPFGGEEEAGVQANFPEGTRTSETALLFLQFIMRSLKRPKGDRPGGRCAMVLPNGPLFADGVAARIKEDLLKNYNLHTIVRLPNGVFAPYTSIPTNLLFFQRDGPTQEIWYYELPLPEGARTTPRPSRCATPSSTPAAPCGTSDPRPSTPGECRWRRCLRTTTTWTSRTPAARRRWPTARRRSWWSRSWSKSSASLRL